MEEVPRDHWRQPRVGLVLVRASGFIEGSSSHETRVSGGARYFTSSQHTPLLSELKDALRKGIGLLGVGDVEEQARSRLWRRVARRLLSARARRRLHMWFGDLWTAYRKDRRFLVRELIPAAGRRGSKVLFIGCRKYTKHYPALLAAHGVECWTIDIDPIAARWGAPERHVIGDILDEPDHWPASSFDTIILNGVFGFGLNSERDQDAALRACRLLLTKDGWLILGWNTDRCIDPSELPAFRNHFRCSSFPGLAQRQTFAKSTHVYGTFTAMEVE